MGHVRAGKMKVEGAAGGTLLELMITVCFLVFAIAGLFSSFIYSTLLNETSANTVKAANDAQYVLEHMKSVPYGALPGYVPPALSSLPNETITLQKNIGWRVTEVTANVTWKERNRNRSLALTTRYVR